MIAAPDAVVFSEIRRVRVQLPLGGGRGGVALLGLQYPEGLVSRDAPSPLADLPPHVPVPPGENTKRVFYSFRPSRVYANLILRVYF